MHDALQVVIRPSRDADVEGTLAIYRHHIRRGIDEGVDDRGTPQPDDLRERCKNLRNRRFPHLVATRGGAIVGYAYVVLFRNARSCCVLMKKPGAGARPHAAIVADAAGAGRAKNP